MSLTKMYIPDKYSDLELPYFVYGTLRPGLWNDGWWQNHGATAQHDGEAVVSGHRLHVSSFPIPYVFETGDVADTVTGALIYPVQNDGSPVLSRMQLRNDIDTLESYPMGYDRKPVQVDTPDGPETAVMYFVRRAPEGFWVRSGNFTDVLADYS